MAEFINRETLSLINRKNAEIERLQTRVGELIRQYNNDIGKVKSEVIKEFAERLKEELRLYTENNGGFVPSMIDNLVKEMLGEPSKIEHDSLCETETYKAREE